MSDKWNPTPIPTPAYGPPIPHEIREFPVSKQFGKVSRIDGAVDGFVWRVGAPEDTDEWLFIEVDPPFSEADRPRPSVTARLKYLGAGRLDWEELASLEELRGRAIDTIDAAGEALRMEVITRLTQTPEYQRAEQHAREYRAAGYPEGEDAYVPPGVASWAQAKWREGWTARQAADDILATADRWYAILDDIRALRLTNKEDVRAAATPAEIAAICSDMDNDMRAIAQQLQLTTTL